MDKVVNKIEILIAAFIKRKFLFSVFEAVSVIAPGNKQNYTIPKAFRFSNEIF